LVNILAVATAGIELFSAGVDATGPTGDAHNGDEKEQNRQSGQAPHELSVIAE
jgi:hypothetical protein